MRHLVDSDTYDRWSNGNFSIARYSWWGTTSGTFFCAYDLKNFSRRINDKPLASYEEALALCFQKSKGV